MPAIVKLTVCRDFDTQEYSLTKTNLTQNLAFGLNSPLIGSLTRESFNDLTNRSVTTKVKLIVYDGEYPRNNFDKSKLIYNDWVALSVNGSNQAVVSLTVAMRAAIMKMFPFTEAWKCLRPSDLKQPEELTESYRIASVPLEGKPGGWVIYPSKKITGCPGNKELDALIKCMCAYGSNTHISKEKTEKTSKRSHFNRIETSTEWKPAEEFTADVTTWENCIYTLAGDPDENGICDVYIGEATNRKESSYKRLRTFRIGGRIFIDHTEEEAKLHRFTRFRIDKMKDDAAAFLHDAQDLAIGIAYMLRKECPNGYRMTNSAQAKAFNEAKALDKQRYGKR